MKPSARRRLRTLAVYGGLLLAASACAHPAPVADGHVGSPPVVDPATRIAFGARAVLKPGSPAVFADGLVVRLDRVDDSRCPPRVSCVWAGELAPRLTLHGGRLSSAQEVKLGTTLKRKESVGAYDIALVDAALDSATLVVTTRR